MLETRLYQQVKKNAHDQGLPENSVLFNSLKRGMNNYWLHVLKEEKDEYERLKKKFKEYTNDSIILEKLINQNSHFKELLKSDAKTAEIGDGKK